MMPLQKRTFFLMIFCFVTLCCQVRGTSNPKRQTLLEGVTLLSSRTGALFIDNRVGHYFTLRIEGRSIKTGKPGTTDTREAFLEVDGLPLQVLVIPTTDFSTTKKRVDPKVLLAKHRETELKAMRESQPDLKENAGLKKNSDLNGRPTLLWGFDFPDGVSEARGQVYLTTPIKKGLLVLTGVVQKEGDRKTVAAFLTKTLGTLSINKNAYDIATLQKQLTTASRTPASSTKGSRPPTSPKKKSQLENPHKR